MRRGHVVRAGRPRAGRPAAGRRRTRPSRPRGVARRWPRGTASSSADGLAAARTSSEQTPWTGSRPGRANASALVIPTRNDVNGPGPTPTARSVTSPTDRPAATRTSRSIGASSSPCRRAPISVASASTAVPSWTATVTAGVDVSRARRSTRPGYGRLGRRLAAYGRASASAAGPPQRAPIPVTVTQRVSSRCRPHARRALGAAQVDDSRSSASPSTLPDPHSTTVTESASEASRSRSSTSTSDPSR